MQPIDVVVVVGLLVVVDEVDALLKLNDMTGPELLMLLMATLLDAPLHSLLLGDVA